MIVTNQFFLFFYYGLNGLGGWFLFLLLGLASVIWLIYDSQVRRLRAIGWRMAIILVMLLIIPAILYRFTIDPMDPAAITQPLYPFSEPIFYLGLLGGILPPVIAVGYYVTFQGLKGCPQGHVYESRQSACPECARLAPQPQIVQQVKITGPGPEPRPEEEPPAPMRPPKPKAQAWLAASNGRTYQLCQGVTLIGRGSDNDIQLTGDTTVGRQHIKIIETNGRFRLHDVGAQNRTRLNGRMVREPELLEPDDEIQIGDNTTLRFVSGGH
jgi:hypothetical protein